LTHVLGDGTTTYLYGYERIAQNSTAAGKQYFLNDALGSVRRLTNAGGAPTLTRSYEPYGKVLGSSGSGSTAYGFAGEWTDNTGLIHLRARYYASGVGRFVQRDPWRGDVYRPGTLNGWNYTLSNPINYTDPSGREPILPILVCLGLVVADGPAPIGDAVCAALLAGTAGVATFSLTVAMNPPTQYTGIQYSNFTLDQPTFPPLIFPLPEPQPSRPLVFPLPQQRLNRPLIFPLPAEGQIPCNTSPFPLHSGLNLPPYTPPFPLSGSLNVPRVYHAATAKIFIPGPGTLTVDEALELQDIADRFNTQLEVGGSRAAEKGRNIDNVALPVGKGGGTRSDIDIRIDGQVDIDTEGALSDAILEVGNGAGKVMNPFVGLTRPTPPIIVFRPRQPPIIIK
jgi:RHS repeat-associated protein